MKFIRSLGLVLSLLLVTSFTSNTTVYVCDSDNSVAFHSIRACRGLNRCTHKIIEVKKSEAVNRYKKRACNICY